VVDLKLYIQEQLKAGYDINTLRHYLQQYGYSVKQIEQAIQSIYAPPHPKREIPWKIIIPSLSVVLLIIISISFISFKPTPEQPLKLLDLETEKISEIGAIGEVLEFKVNLFNFGAKPRFDVFLEHRLLDLDGNIKQTVKETIAVETRTSKVTKMPLPGTLPPGNYKIKTLARYEGLLATAQFDFPAEIFKKCPASCDDGNECTEDVCEERTGFECHYIQLPNCPAPLPEPEPEPEELPPLPAIDETIPEEEIVDIPPPPLREKNTIEIIEDLKELMQNDPEAAKKECETLSHSEDVDYCYETLAAEAQDSNYCDIIQDADMRDRCYSNYALNTLDFSVCERISDEDFKESCEELGAL